MKKIATLFFSLIFVFILSGCGFLKDVSSSAKDEVNSVEMLNYLKNNISSNSTIDEIFDVFEKMCEMPIEDDLLLDEKDDILLHEYGVYNFTGEDLFYYDLVRQYPDGEGEYYQLRVSVMFSPDKENRELQDTLWSDETNENFFDYIRKFSGYNYAKNHNFNSIDIRIDQT